MKTKIFSMLAAAGLMFGLGSCTDNPDYPLDKEKQTGSVSLSELGVEVNLDEVVVSRADIDTSGFLVQIVDAAGESAYEATVASCSEIVTLPVADGYRILIKSHEVENAAWSAPYYYGEKSFDIKANEITEIGTVNCSFANIRVSVKYSEKLQSLLGDDVNVLVKCSENGSELNFAGNETRSGYFKALPGSTTLAAEFEGTVKGQKARLVKALADVKAGQHRIITFDVRTPDTTIPDEFGGITVDGEGNGVKLDDGLYLFVDVVNVDVNGNVTSEETGDSSAERPGKEEPGTLPDKPDEPKPADEFVKIEASGMSFTSVMDPSTVTDGIVEITAENGIENLFVEIVPGGEEFAGVLNSMEMPLKFDLAHTKNATERETMEGFTFPVDENVVGQTYLKLNITEFVPLLGLYAGEPKFILTVTDKQGNSLSKTLSFKVVK